MIELRSKWYYKEQELCEDINKHPYWQIQQICNDNSNHWYLFYKTEDEMENTCVDQDQKDEDDKYTCYVSKKHYRENDPVYDSYTVFDSKVKRYFIYSSSLYDTSICEISEQVFNDCERISIDKDKCDNYEDAIKRIELLEEHNKEANKLPVVSDTKAFVDSINKAISTRSEKSTPEILSQKEIDDLLAPSNHKYIISVFEDNDEQQKTYFLKNMKFDDNGELYEYDLCYNVDDADKFDLYKNIVNIKKEVENAYKSSEYKNIQTRQVNILEIVDEG